MRFNAPKRITWFIALILGIIGIVANLVTIPVLSGLSFWIVVIALALMLLATALKGL